MRDFSNGLGSGNVLDCCGESSVIGFGDLSLTAVAATDAEGKFEISFISLAAPFTSLASSKVNVSVDDGVPALVLENSVFMFSLDNFVLPRRSRCNTLLMIERLDCVDVDCGGSGNGC